MSIADAAKRLVVGRKLASDQIGETLLSKRVALPVFSSDALSSVAYAPDEILLTLSLAGMAGYAFSWKIGLLVSFVMLVVVASYRQTVYAYPNGGGGYEVARSNLGRLPALVVASALLVDYTLTVAVSVSSGVDNAKGGLPWMKGHEVLIVLLVIAFVAAMNLRGMRESGAFFAIPTYCFMLGIFLTVGWGLFQILVLHRHLASAAAKYDIAGVPPYSTAFAGVAMVSLIARAFSSGSSALTGVEAISNSVPAFKRPKSRNAAVTLVELGVLAVSMLMGILVLAKMVGVRLIDAKEGAHFVLPGTSTPVNYEAETTISQLAGAVFGHGSVMFYFVTISTMIILFIAANTAFNGFPVLGSILARDGFLPTQLHTRGDRLAFSNGIVFLATAAAALVVAFHADVSSMIQLYVIGVFVSFTISQAGLIVHWTRLLRGETDPSTRRRMLSARTINTTGMVLTFVVLIVVLVSKWVHGAYLAIIAMALMFLLMLAISRHYTAVARETHWRAGDPRSLPSRVHAVVLVLELNKPTVRAVEFAKATRASTLEAITVAVDPDETTELVGEWDAGDLGVPLRVIASPFREVTNPFVTYVKNIRSVNPRDIVCVYVPEYVVGHWWEQFLHNQTALILRTRLHFTPGVMVASVPYLLKSSSVAEVRLERDHGKDAWRQVTAEDEATRDVML